MIKKILFLVAFLFAAGYLLFPDPKFPAPPPGGRQSTDPADLESVFRRGYYTNLSRQEIMDYYYASLGNWGIRQIIPPEDAYTVIRDQTRSSYLEEIIHPWRDSLYINAYVPIKPSEQINIDGVHYLNKVTIRYLPSTQNARLTVFLGVVLTGYWLFKSWRYV